MKKQMAIFLCMCAALCFSACAFGQTSESADNASSVEISSSLEAGENSSEASSEIEEGAYRIYYDLSLANACVPNDIAISYDETKGMYYTEALFGEAYTLNVSSLGIDRPFKTDKDFLSHIGERVEVKLYSSIRGKKFYDGILTGYDKQTITLKVDEKTTFTIEMKNVVKVNEYVDF